MHVCTDGDQLRYPPLGDVSTAHDEDAAPGQAQTGRELLRASGERGLTVMLRVDGAEVLSGATSPA